jgi:hypothetical protein
MIDHDRLKPKENAGTKRMAPAQGFIETIER